MPSAAGSKLCTGSMNAGPCLARHGPGSAIMTGRGALTMERPQGFGYDGDNCFPICEAMLGDAVVEDPKFP